MLGLCWTPAAMQGMQKVASTMPSNPEQLLGAILVRRDIFQRFENTMHDTCLDANNLLEYLFSLYNSTAAPTERENFPSNPSVRPHVYSNNTKRQSGPGRRSVMPSYDPNAQHQGNQGFQHMQQHLRLEGSPRGQHQVPPEIHITPDSHRKRVKREQHLTDLDSNKLVGAGGLHPDFPHAAQMKNYDGHPVFPGAQNNMSGNVKLELSTPERDSHHHTQSSSPLPPFSQIRRQGRPFSPGSSQLQDTLQVASQPDEAPQNFGMDTSTGDAKVDGADKTVKVGDSPQLYRENATSTPLKDSSSSEKPERGERGKRPKRHQCFCGAMFTRADNLKRHVRKCHEEKLEKLAGTAPSLLESEGSGGQFSGDFQEMFPSSGQEMPIDQLQQDGSEQQPQQQHQDESQQQQQQQQQPQQINNEVGGLAGKNAASGMMWSCFCGESFDDHRQLVEHTRSHENNP